jgi:hypothetical protein
MKIHRSTAAAAVLPAALALAVALGACAAMPDPAREAAVSGSLVLEFPDGFLGQPPRTVDSYILLHVRSLTTGRRYLRTVRDGRFSLPAAGDLRISRYEFSLSGPGFSCYLNDWIGIDLRTQPGQPLELGRIVLRYTRPRPSRQATFARRTPPEGFDPELGQFGFFQRLRQDYWDYDRALLRLDPPLAPPAAR